MSPSYKSTIQDWAFCITGKKAQKHTLWLNWNEACKAIDKIEDRIKKIEKQDPNSDLLIKLKSDIKELEDQKSKINKSMNRDSFSDSNLAYQTLYIHKIGCPKTVYHQAIKFFHDMGKAEYKPEDFGFWAWGAQIFIIDKWLPHLEILDIEELNKEDILDIDERMCGKRGELMENFKDPAYNF